MVPESRKVDILYDIQHPEAKEGVGKAVFELMNRRDVAINMNIIEGYELLDCVKGFHYDVVILHLGGNGYPEGAFRQADKCRRLTDAKLVAESVMLAHPVAKKLCLEHFDAVIGPLYMDHNLENLLEGLNFLTPDYKTDDFR